MSQSTELKTKLVRSTHQQAQRHRPVDLVKPQIKISTPSIKLKTDFSNFN